MRHLALIPAHLVFALFLAPTAHTQQAAPPKPMYVVRLIEGEKVVRDQQAHATFFLGEAPDTKKPYLEIRLGDQSGLPSKADEFVLQINYLTGMPYAGQVYEIQDPYPGGQKDHPFNDRWFYVMVMRSTPTPGAVLTYYSRQGSIVFKEVSESRLSGALRFRAYLDEPFPGYPSEVNIEIAFIAERTAPPEAEP